MPATLRLLVGCSLISFCGAAAGPSTTLAHLPNAGINAVWTGADLIGFDPAAPPIAIARISERSPFRSSSIRSRSAIRISPFGCVRLALDRSLLRAHSVTGDGLMPFSRPLVSERGDRDPLHGGATDKEEVHRTSPLQGRLPASSADRLQTLTRRKTSDLAPRFMHRNVSGLQAWR